MTDPRAPRRRRRHPLLWLAACWLVAACGVSLGRHEWNRERHGAVVPHDSFPADCSLCHDASNGDWYTIREDFSFDHTAETGLPLEGAHAEASCLMCHNDRGPVAEFAVRGCAGCHEDVHRGFQGDRCEICHDDQVTWRVRGQVALHNRTRLPLVGAHAAVACFRCHRGAEGGNFAGLDPDCGLCHAADLARATSPDHAAQGWTQDCEDCHVPIAWRPARFAHPASFPLTGGHAGLECTACHSPTTYTGLSTDCASCHLTDYQNTTDPSHVGSSFPTSCQDCHSTIAWRPARFAHPTTFPLEGGHAGRSCSECHTPGTYAGLSTDCTSCHLTDYQNTTDPNHASSGFPTTCRDCHTTTRWEGAVFNHTFPLRGEHDVSCSRCHTAAAPAPQFTCFECHEHRQSAMDDKHREVNGYTYTSAACVQCHPNGRH